MTAAGGLPSAADLLAPDRDPVVGERAGAVLTDARTVAAWAAANTPRSRQTAVGPSELGMPCARRLGYRAAGTPTTDHPFDPWPATVGTAVHAWLADAYTRVNESLTAHGRPARYLVEHPVRIPEYEIRGSVDLVDLDQRTVIDHKVLGAASLRSFTLDGPSAQYRAQVHLYAVGLRAAGVDVDHVAVLAWPRSGLTIGARIWLDDVDEDLVDRVLRRWELVERVAAAGPDTPDLLPPTDNPACPYCPWRSRCAAHPLDPRAAGPGQPE